ncbi:iron ABC transporter permease [Synergistales bacterium]|nr:iron ABC transporter permease [Synergistales bacterium]
MSDLSVAVSDLRLSMGRHEILKGVSLDAPRGSFLCIVGRNGAGKSTILKCIAGVIKGAGEIRIDGRNVSSLSPPERSRLVAYVPQSAPSDVPYTAREFLEMSRYPWRSISNPSEDRRAIDDAVDLTGLSDLMDRRLSTLSGGERQKVMIASAIAQGSGVMLMDEPTTYLDYAHQAETMSVMERVNRERGVTIIAVTHDVNLAVLMSARVVAVSGGLVCWSGSPSKLTSPDMLRDIFGVDFETCRSDGGLSVVVPVMRSVHE